MNSTIDPDKIRIPAFLRNKAIVRQAKQQLILTALDRKMAGLGVHSSKPLAPFVRKKSLLQNRKNKFPENGPKNKKADFSKAINIPAHNNFLIIPIGMVIDYYDKIKVAVIRLEETLRVGDIIQIATKNMFFQQQVESIQINRKPVKMAKKSAEMGLKVMSQPEINGPVYKVVPAEIKKAPRAASEKSSKAFAHPLF